MKRFYEGWGEGEEAAAKRREARREGSFHGRTKDDAVDIGLNPGISDPESLTHLLKPPPEDFLERHPVEKSLFNSGLTDTLNVLGLDYALLLRKGM